MIHHIKNLSLIMLGIALFFFIGCMSQKTSLYSQNSEKLSGSDRKVYELQEQCEKHAAALFKKEYGKGYEKYKDGSYMSNYTNHYNFKLNKCFILINITYVPNSIEEDALIMKELRDINKNKPYGSLGRFKNSPFQSAVQWRMESAHLKVNGILLLKTTWKNSWLI